MNETLLTFLCSWVALSVYGLFTDLNIMNQPFSENEQLDWKRFRKVDIIIFLIQAPVLLVIMCAWLLTVAYIWFSTTPSGAMILYWISSFFKTIFRWLSSPIKN